MTYRLYSNDGSGSGIVEMALATLGAPYELSNVSFQQGEQNRPEYARLNPQRKVPTLVTPAGEVLTESAAILLVLDERHPEAIEQEVALPWFLSSGFSFCDVYLAVLSRWSLNADWRREQLPKVEAIAQAVAHRERLAPIWQRHHGHRTP